MTTSDAAVAQSDSPIRLLIITSNPGDESRFYLEGVAGATTVDELKKICAAKAGYGPIAIHRISLIASGRRLLDGQHTLEEVFRDFPKSSDSPRAVHLLIKSDPSNVSDNRATATSASVLSSRMGPSLPNGSLRRGAGFPVGVFQIAGPAHALGIHSSMMDSIQQQTVSLGTHLQQTLAKINANEDSGDPKMKLQALGHISDQLRILQMRVEKLQNQNQTHGDYLRDALATNTQETARLNPTRAVAPSSSEPVVIANRAIDTSNPTPHLVLNPVGEPIAMAIPPDGLGANHHHTFRATIPSAQHINAPTNPSPPPLGGHLSTEGGAIRDRTRPAIPNPQPRLMEGPGRDNPVPAQAAAVPAPQLARLGSIFWVLIRLLVMLFLFGVRVSFGSSLLFGIVTALVAYLGMDRRAFTIIRQIRTTVIQYLCRHAGMADDLTQGVNIAVNATEPNPAATAARLLRERQERAGVVRKAITAVQRAIFTFLATLDPHIAEVRAAVVRRAIETEEARVQALAVAAASEATETTNDAPEETIDANGKSAGSERDEEETNTQSTEAELKTQPAPSGGTGVTSGVDALDRPSLRLRSRAENDDESAD